MRCKICGSALSQPSYREIYPFFNFPAHTVKNWGICKQQLLSSNFQPAYVHLPSILNFAPRLSQEYADIRELLHSPDNSFDLLMKVDRLGDMLRDVFPDASLVNEPSMYIPAEIQLDNATYQKLVAHELEFTVQTPTHLKTTTAAILNDIQTGKLQLSSPFYYGTVPTSRSFQSVRVPAELVKALKHPWISSDRALERVLMEYAERVETLEQNDDVAFQILKNDIRPSTIKRRVTGRPVSATLSYIKASELPGDKRAAIRKALQGFDAAAVVRLAEGVSSGKHASVRVDYEDGMQIKKLAKDLNIPAYKLTTALLLYANCVKV